MNHLCFALDERISIFGQLIHHLLCLMRMLVQLLLMISLDLQFQIFDLLKLLLKLLECIVILFFQVRFDLFFLFNVLVQLINSLFQIFVELLICLHSSLALSMEKDDLILWR